MSHFQAELDIVLKKSGDDVRVVHGSYEEGRFVALTGRAGRLVGALAFNEPRKLMGWRRPIEARSTWAEALAQAGPTSLID